MTKTELPAVHDLVTSTGGTARIEYVTGDAYLVSTYGDRWSVPVQYLVLTRPAVRGGSPAEWTVSPDWTS